MSPAWIASADLFLQSVPTLRSLHRWRRWGEHQQPLATVQQLARSGLLELHTGIRSAFSGEQNVYGSVARPFSLGSDYWCSMLKFSRSQGAFCSVRNLYRYILLKFLVWVVLCRRLLKAGQQGCSTSAVIEQTRCAKDCSQCWSCRHGARRKPLLCPLLVRLGILRPQECDLSPVLLTCVFRRYQPACYHRWQNRLFSLQILQKSPWRSASRTLRSCYGVGRHKWRCYLGIRSLQVRYFGCKPQVHRVVEKEVLKLRACYQIATNEVPYIVIAHDSSSCSSMSLYMRKLQGISFCKACENHKPFTSLCLS